MMLNSLLFSLIFLFISNWFQIVAFLSVPFKKVKISTLDNSWIYKTVREKTGLKLLAITIFHDKKMYGMMAGLPFWPKMILSEGLYKKLNKDELEWVILHEAGHCVMWHNLKVFLIEMLFLVSGIILIYFYKTGITLSVLLSIVLSLVSIQVIRWLIEYQADKFSIERVTNPKGVITAQDKFRNAYHKNLFSSEKSLGRFLLHWNIYPSKRIEMAKARIADNLSSN
jgi:Zn-dependent protease with chaperone function